MGMLVCIHKREGILLRKVTMDNKDFEIVKELIVLLTVLRSEDCVLVENVSGAKKTKELVKEAMRQTGTPRKYKYIWSGSDQAQLIVFLTPSK